MELIERYVHKVAAGLPRRMRDDVREELRSLLTDSLAARAREQGRPADEAMAAALLHEFGHPDEVALRYHEPQYLIGPRLYNNYIFVVMLVLGIMAALVIAAKLLTARLDWRLPANLIELALTNIGLLTVIFAVLERAEARKRASTQGKEWDPVQLEPVKDPEKVDIPGRVIGMWMLVALAFVFNLRFDWVQSSFSPQFLFFIPLLNVVWAADFALSFLLIQRGRWNLQFRGFDLAIGLGSLLVLGGILYVRPFSGPGGLFAMPVIVVIAVIELIETVVQAVKIALRVGAGDSLARSASA
jgi:hypothetical protein